MQLIFRTLFPALLLFALLAQPSLGQTSAGRLQVHVEVTPSVLTLVVKSEHIDFGAVREDAGEVRLDPATGERWGLASGAWSTGEVQVLGPTGYSYGVQVVAPTHLRPARGAAEGPRFTLLWAQSPNCSSDTFTEQSSGFSTRGTLGVEGCARLRFGGGLELAGAAPGEYSGLLEVHFIAI